LIIGGYGFLEGNRILNKSINEKPPPAAAGGGCKEKRFIKPVI